MKEMTSALLLESLLSAAPKFSLATLPTPIHPLHGLSRRLGGPELWIKRDDLTGLAGGGNKTRKLEFVVADAISRGADTLVTVGAIQSNHTRQTAAAAARAGLRCALLHNGWAPDVAPYFRKVGNVLLSQIMGAELYVDEAPRAIGDEGQLGALASYLQDQGRRPYVIPGGASEHPLGGFGYAACAEEIAAQSARLGIDFDFVVHCTGSSSTQAGLVAGFAALRSTTQVIGVADDNERDEKCERVHRLANATLIKAGLAHRVSQSDVHVVVADQNPYGVASEPTLEAIRLLAQTEGLIADPVYEGKAIRGLIELIRAGRLRPGQRVLLMHLGGTPAIHAWADHFWREADLHPVPECG
jgi:1-aminocyclopropane-1-carboxylate deaminase